MVSVWLAIGIVGGFLVLATAGIAAAFVGHAITRFALFMTMGQPERAAVEQIRTTVGGTGDGGAYIIKPHEQPGRGPVDSDGRGGAGPVRPA